MSITSADAFDPIAAIDAWLDESITPAEHAALDAWLAADPAHPALLAARARLHRNLLVSLASPASDPKARGPLSADESDADPSIPFKPDLSPPGAKVRVPRTPTLRPPKRLVYALAAALFLAAAVVAIYVSTQTPDRRPLTHDSAAIASVLDISDASTLMIDDEIARPGEEYAGRSISLDAGEAEFMLPRRVGVRLRGATELRVHDAMSATLVSGSASFDCPPEAVGYTVHLPQGVRVVDLGTRFVVHVDKRGDATVDVLSGSVRVETPGVDRRVVVEGRSIAVASGRLGEPEAIATRPLLRETFDDSATLNLTHGGAVVNGDLLLGRTMPSDTGSRLRLTKGHAAWVRVIERIEPRLREAGLIGNDGLIGPAGATVYIAWTAAGERTDPQGLGGLSLFVGEKESLFVGKARDRADFSFDYQVAQKTPLDANPATPAIDPIAIERNAHRFVIRIDYHAGPDRVRLWIDPDPDAEPPLANAVLDNVQVKFDRIRLLVDRGQSTFPADAPIGPWSFDDLRIGTSWKSVMTDRPDGSNRIAP